MALMRELPEKQRVALALFYIQELSLAEIASAVCAPEGTVKAWLSRGRERLRRLAVERGLV
jgi:RNA polymerase sigma-70 factor (ECF subfamily)